MNAGCLKLYNSSLYIVHCTVKSVQSVSEASQSVYSEESSLYSVVQSVFSSGVALSQTESWRETDQF